MMIAMIWSLNLSHVRAAQAWLPGAAASVRRPDWILAQVHNQTLAAIAALHLKFWTLAQAQGRTKVAATQGRPLKNGLVLLIFDMLMMLLKSFMLVRLPIGDN
jgi:hypothetical protein